MKRLGSVFLGIVLGLVFIFFDATAQETPAIPEAATTEVSKGEQIWELRLAPYLWAAGLNADSTVQGSKSSVDMSFSDIFERMDGGFIGYAEVKRKRLFFFTNMVYMAMSDDVSVSESSQCSLGPNVPPNFPTIGVNVK